MAALIAASAPPPPPPPPPPTKFLKGHRSLEAKVASFFTSEAGLHHSQVGERERKSHQDFHSFRVAKGQVWQEENKQTLLSLFFTHLRWRGDGPLVPRAGAPRSSQVAQPPEVAPAECSPS
ncbi:hypothetical protein C0Q70_13447 [Pomacea canaliculata]|uniref:Uncharacterized protein n=1 Tax=Pomacea canaliculata TaxID=400727 RepID=A0A2T7NX82_POMCA|nr:hypothetical protein C0Q70_13447 [Pomacea canaliculata]